MCPAASFHTASWAEMTPFLGVNMDRKHKYDGTTSQGNWGRWAAGKGGPSVVVHSSSTREAEGALQMQAQLVYTVNSRPARATQWGPPVLQKEREIPGLVKQFSCFSKKKIQVQFSVPMQQQPSQRNQTLSSLLGPCMYVVYRHTGRQSINMHKIIFFKRPQWDKVRTYLK